MSTSATPVTTATTSNQPRKRIARPRKKQLTPKQKLIKESAQQRFKIEKLVFVWQEKLFSQANVTAQTLQRATTYLQPKTYKEIVEERVVQNWCGYPLCHSTPKTQELQKYKISLSQRKVYDQTDLANYCSDNCYHKSKYYILQLSEDPVWFRDFNIVPTTHIITLEEDFNTAIRQEKKKTQILKSTQAIRHDYVQHLLARVPKDTKENFEIIEKSTVSPIPPSAADAKAGVYDSIEGYRIEIKKDGKSPTTMILKKKEQDTKQEHKAQKEQEIEHDPEDPDALFETMMMLKDMNLDKLQSADDKQQERMSEAKELVPVRADAALKKKNNSTLQEKQNEQPIISSAAVVSSSKPTREEQEKDTNVIKVTTKTPKKSIKKKKKGPELSLFGAIWTMLDHMTTKATRVYLNELQNNKHRVDLSNLLMEENLMDEAIYLRGQILSERILDTYAIIRTQLEIRENLEDDIVNVIKTFRLSDASMIALNPAQCYMMSLVLIKSLADILVVDTEWKYQFEDCCKTVDQSTDMVDACVRVLKVASV